MGEQAKLCKAKGGKQKDSLDNTKVCEHIVMPKAVCNTVALSKSPCLVFMLVQ